MMLSLLLWTINASTGGCRGKDLWLYQGEASLAGVSVVQRPYYGLRPENCDEYRMLRHSVPSLVANWGPLVTL
jgi:hypothetical protein